MTKVTLKDGTELNAIAVHSTQKLMGDKQRQVLIFMFPEGTDISGFTEENCSVITLTDEQNNSYPWENYTIYLSSGHGAIADIIVGSADMTPCEWVKMMQITPEEIRIKELEARLAALEA